MNADGKPFHLALAPRRAADTEAAAWLLPGGDAAQWLAELARFAVPLDEVRLLLLPRSRRDRAPGAALALLGPGQRPHRVLQAQAFAVRAGRLFHPLDCELQPPIDDAELAALLAWPFAILHPTLGLVGCADDELLRAVDLLALPNERAADWSRARAGERVAAALVAVLPADEVAFEQVFAAEHESIGSRSLTELAPDTPPDARVRRPRRSLRRRALAALERLLARLVLAIERLLARAPGSGATGTDSPLGRWARRVLARTTATPRSSVADEDRRTRELDRLWRLLETDPDEGLRYALPFGGEASRGLAPPSNSLTRQQTEFDLARLGGGQAADSWQLDWTRRQQLMAKYRELANRELARGQHRRAAYIFAHLLGDLRAAAAALQQGGHHREAALLYRDKLADLDGAAKCLAAGGLLAEAADLYEQRERFEDAGDLRLVLDQRGEAERLYRAALQQRLAAGETIAAALLEAEKLGLPDQALQRLDAAWQANGGATELGALLALQLRLERETELQRSIADALAAGPPTRRVLAAGTVAELVGHYRDTPLRAFADDELRRCAAELLPTAGAEDCDRLLRAIRALDPDDRLLARDTARVADRLHRRPAPRPITATGTPPRLQLLRACELPQGEWCDAATASTHLTVVGRWNGRGLTVRVRSITGGAAERDTTSTTESIPLRVLAPRASSADLLIVARHRDEPHPRAFAANGAEPWTELFTGLRPMLACARDDDDSMWLLGHDDGPVVLDHFAPDGSLLGSVHLGSAPSPGDLRDTTAANVAATRGYVALGMGNRILLRAPDGKLQVVQVEGHITAITAAPTFARPRFLVSTAAAGFALLDVSNPGVASATSGHGWRWLRPAPLLAFASGDVIVATARDGLRCFLASAPERPPSPPTALPADFTPLAIVPAWDARHVVVVGQTRVLVFELVQASASAP